MEYPFKDLMPLDEATARDGYYKDWTHIDADTFHQISELVKFIREKGYGVDTREAIAQALERVYHDALISGNANMEVSMARKNFVDLAARLDASDDDLRNFNVNWINKNLGKLDQTFMSEEFLQQMAGNTPVNAVPADGSITSSKIADKSVTKEKVSSSLENLVSRGYYDDENMIFTDDLSGWTPSNNFFTSHYHINGSGDYEVHRPTSTAVVQRVMSNEKITENTHIHFEYTATPEKTSGFMIGVADDFQAGRELIGYEPAYNAVVAFLESPVGFKTLESVTSPKQIIFDIFLHRNETFVVLNQSTIFKLSSFSQISNFGKRLQIQFKAYEKGDTIKKFSIKKSSENPYNLIKGRTQNVYKFGGKGNDWCFVRTPDNYKPDGKPHPFVIANHGNGWVMDGTSRKANWTDITMYVDEDEYNSNPSRFNLVPSDQPHLLHSNPTIEKLLEAGYIVCGTQNYADNLYGNKDCRQAMTDFYFHMINNFNVEEKCFMIGASNGAMTSLNGMYLLGGVSRVKAMILQYPLTSLWGQYNGYSNHRTAIENAYGISSGLTEDEFEKATRTHDPEKVNTVVIGTKRIKTTSMPPMKFYYSLGDPVTHPDNNSLRLMQVLEDSNHIYEGVEATGSHGDPSHFDPEGYLDFFEKYR